MSARRLCACVGVRSRASRVSTASRRTRERLRTRAWPNVDVHFGAGPGDDDDADDGALMALMLWCVRAEHSLMPMMMIAPELATKFVHTNFTYC